MKDRPILFSGPMVRALLAGTKTQTRRVIKPQPDIAEWQDAYMMRPKGGRARFRPVGPDWPDSDKDDVYCRYGQPGDRLWVRETFARIDGQTRPWIETDYRATYTHGDRLGDSLGIKKRWTPSIHMPRHASRITLEVTAVRVERLQDISPNDCIAEGAWPVEKRELGRGHEAVVAYRTLWEEINGTGSWAENPWVWVLEFRRLQDGTAA